MAQVLARVSLIALALGLWWVVLAPISRWAIRPLRALLPPLLDRYERRHAIWLGVTRTLVSIAAASYLFLA